MKYSLADIQEKIKDFIVSENGLDSKNNTLTNDLLLMEAGFLDSMMVVSLITYCEEEFSCEFDLTEIDYNDFASINNIANSIFRISGVTDQI